MKDYFIGGTPTTILPLYHFRLDEHAGVLLTVGTNKSNPVVAQDVQDVQGIVQASGITIVTSLPYF